MELVKFIEDVQEFPFAEPDVLTDDALRVGGLVKTEAFVRTRSSVGALRVKRHREAREQDGLKQLNIVVPDAFREEFKSWAKLASEGQPFGQVREVEVVKEVFQPRNLDAERVQRKLLGFTGFKRLLACWLGLIEYLTYADVKQAAEIVINRGDDPVIYSVWRELGGKHSYTSIHKHLSKFLQELNN